MRAPHLIPVVVALVLLGRPAAAAEIELLSGEVLRGAIVSETADAIVFEKTDHDARVELPLPKRRIHRLRADAGAAWRVITAREESATATVDGGNDATAGDRTATAAPGNGAEPGWVGYGGPGGSRVYPGRAPTGFDHSTGAGVLWETPLPSWGHGSPIFVAGKVFAMCEVSPDHVFPFLVCLDAATGEILWEREIDHLPAITPDAAKRKALRQRVKAYYDRANRAIADWIAAGKPKTGDPKKDKELRREEKALHQAMGLFRDTYKISRNAYNVIGEAYGTPVSDGESVYAATAWGGYACFDLAGELRWLSFAPSASNSWDNKAPSPILHGRLLIHSNAGTHRAFDRRTGELLWSHDIGFGGIATPAVITVGGRDVLLTPSASAHLLPSGERLEVEGWRDPGMQILVKYDEPDVAFFCGSGEHCSWHQKGGGDPPNPPAALRFSFAGDTLKAELLWDGNGVAAATGRKRKEVLGGNAPWMLYHEGRFYHRGGFVLDALTGEPIAGLPRRERYSPKGVPETGHILAVCGDHVYGLGRHIKWPTRKRYEHLEGKPTACMHVMTLDGKFVGDGVLLRKEPTPEQKAMHAWHCGGNGFPMGEGRKPFFSYGHAFTFGAGRIYIRSIESLICVGSR